MLSVPQIGTLSRCIKYQGYQGDHHHSKRRNLLSGTDVSNSDLHTPVLLVVKLNVPVNFDWAHMTSALNQRCDTILSEQCGVFPLNFEQSPCSVACPPTMLHITSFFAHVHPSDHPGAEI
ncbi:hypothetical protein Lal_00028102 [Lupinus albus]|nr:hypothetical protein Lal_00028102 [Lupinus albus]